MPSLPSQPILRTHAVFAGCLASLVVAACLAGLAFARTALSARPLVFPIAYTTVFGCSTLTAFLLSLQFSAVRKDAIVLLSSAYVFLSVVSLLQLLTMLGFARLVGITRTQPLPWLWICYHGGFPLLVGLARLVPGEDRPVGVVSRTAGAIAVPLLFAVGLVVVLACYSDSLPILLIGDARTTFFDTILLGLCVGTLCILALVFGAGLRDRLDMWVCVTLLVFLADDILSTASRTRYTVGWFGAVSVATLSPAILLCTLLWEVRELYRTLMTLNADLQRQAFRDGLTGVFSRRYFDQTLPRVLEDVAVTAQPVCLMLVDADHFKACNDRYGHQAGDRLLVQLAQTMSTRISRPGQFVARYGGEEFAAVLPGVEPGRVGAIAESLRLAIEQNFVGTDDNAAAPLTVSIGVACLPASSEPVDPAALLEAADQALYAAKRAGRNCVRLHAVALPTDSRHNI
ncbi:diguanylate cyclase [Paraburkholderia nemoris]|uniref:sensor domain-containing diguanylate cyclase n=1 Tax=Paraburkholderia nemoris TaxID=2793076 RepID=UPI0038BC90EB